MVQMITRSEWRLVDWLAACGLVAVVAFWQASDWLGGVEGSQNPVVTDFVWGVLPGSQARLQGTMDIVRPECTGPGVEAYLRSRGSPVEIVFEEGVKDRPGGDQAWGPWRFVGLAADDVDLLVVEVTHQCPWRPWRTRTVLKP